MSKTERFILLVTIAGVIVAILAWLLPFSPIGPSPFSFEKTTPTNANLLIATTDAVYDGWVICWHGSNGYEYLIGYPEDQARQGISLVFDLTNAQGQQADVANDSLKMCYVNGEWYGRPDPNDWFPNVSYLKLLDTEIQVCSDTLCQENQWSLLSEDYFPWNAPQLQVPTQTGISIISYKPSR
jgi:hypothetical protein